MTSPAPVVIGGVGFSGTRVVMRIAQRAGHFMGANLNETEDAMDFHQLAERWSAERHAAWLAGRPVQASWRLRRALAASIRRHRRPLSDASTPWGWKQPRSIHLLPLLLQRFPRLRFIHVIRDGRDLALGSETPYRIAAGARGTGVYSAAQASITPDLERAPAAVRMIAFWSQVNLLANEFGEAEMGDRYRLVRLEDLCTHPEDTVRDLYRFLGHPDPVEGLVAQSVDEIVWPASIGLHRRVQDFEPLERVAETGETALRRFGYAGARFDPPVAASAPGEPAEGAWHD
jgi:hypothetical protein